MVDSSVIKISYINGKPHMEESKNNRGSDGIKGI